MSILKIQYTTLLLLLQIAANLSASPHLTKGIVDMTPDGTQPLLTFPLEGVNDCRFCHSTQNSSSVDKTFLPVSTWEGSMKANAMRDPLFWAAVDVANNDIPGVGDYCLRCHTPSGWLAGNVVKTGIPANPIIDGANGCELSGSHTQSDGFNNDYSGITCHFCHRQDKLGPLGEPQIKRDGIIWVDDQSCANGGVTNPATPCRKGPYDYPASTPVGDVAPHPWQFSTFIKSADFCGSCHNVNSPETSTGFAKTLIDQQGNDTNLAMPIEQTFKEWQNSLFADLLFKDSFSSDTQSANAAMPNLTGGQTCQDCHMPLSDSPDARACTEKAAGSRAGNLRIHQFAGGNTWIPEVLKNLYGSTLQPTRTDAYDRTISYAQDMLQNKSALIEIQNLNLANNIVSFAVKVTNLTGHKLPTGYPEGRRMWLRIQVTDNNSATVFDSGKYNNLTGVLTKDNQIKVYETKQGIYNASNQTCETESNGKEVFHFVLNNCIAKDNRIPPLGFTGGNDVTIKPVGIIYPTAVNSNTLVNYDISNYQFNVSGSIQYPLTISAELLYQTSSKEYIEFLKDSAVTNNTPTENAMCNRSWSEGPANKSRGRFMYDQWLLNGKSGPVIMKNDSQVLSN